MDCHLLAGLILSSLIGLILGLVGGGGAIVTVPVLVYVLGVDEHDAVAMSLAVVGVTSIIGTAIQSKSSNVDYRTGLIFAAVGAVGATAGAQLTYLLSPRALMLLFGIIMLLTGSLMLGRQIRQTSEQQQQKLSKLLLASLLVGVLTGFLGVGGGFLIVPALLLFGGLDVKRAVGTSLLVIAINCIAGFLGHLSSSHLPVTLTAMVTAVATLGMLIGTALSRQLSADVLKKAFSVFVIAVAIFLIIKNHGVIF
ncbi:MAG: sulfite exporter TauE/SafE family protein [Acidobacteriota bacterium]|nr:sulfite exporter TauE/SafE family protein [Blastocatellia bacterium]MDW8413281.1 sulfite exporter TauE/SafE family protein [Acidobacteriota bacterium]